MKKPFQSIWWSHLAKEDDIYEKPMERAMVMELLPWTDYGTGPFKPQLL